MAANRENDGYQDLKRLLEDAERTERRFTAAWRELDTPRLENFLPEEKTANYEFVLLSLMEIEQRERSRRGKPSRKDDWLRRFPAFVEIINDHWPSISGSVSELPEANAFSEPESSSSDSRGIPRVLGGRKLFERIGEGRTTLVYRCESTVGEADAAMRVIRSEFLTKLPIEERERWISQWKLTMGEIREAKAQGVVAIDQIGQEGDQVFACVEAMKGSAGELFSQRTPTPLVVVRQLITVIDSLQSAHEVGLYHGAIRPAKLFYNARGLLKIGGFEFVKSFIPAPQAWREASGGLRRCVAPEVIADPSSRSPCSDIYCLGVMFYQSLSGRPPLDSHEAGSNPTVTIEAAAPIPLRRLNPTIGRRLDSVVCKCLRFRPKDRYGTLSELRSDLQDVTANLEVRAGWRPWRTFWRGITGG